MAENTLKTELFSATNMFNSITKGFRDGIEVKNHNRRLKCYKNSFIAYKGVSFLIDLLKSKEEFANKIKSREQAISLMNIFLRWGIIVKIYPSNNVQQFQDNKDLYTLGQSNDESNSEQKKSINHGPMSKSTNDLLLESETFVKPALNRTTMYRSFGKSTYTQLNQIQNTIKKTTSTIIKSTNNNVNKFANHTAHTLNKLNNKSGNNLIRRLNNNLKNKSINPIRKSTSYVNCNSITQRNSSTPMSVSFNTNSNNSRIFSSHHQENNKENLIMNPEKKFERNYRGHLNRSYNSSVTSLPTMAINVTIPVSLNPHPMNEELCVKFNETEGNNLIRFLTKISDGLKKKPLKPTNTSSLASSTNSCQLIMNQNQVHYIHHIPIPNIQAIQSIHNQTIEHKPINYVSPIVNNNHFHQNCRINPISSSCYNTLV